MRHLITYLFLIILISACYDDYDRTTITIEDREIPETSIEGGLTGRAYNNDGDELTDYILQINDVDYNHTGSYYEYIQDLRKFGQIIYLKDGQDIIGFSNNLLVENDVFSVDIMAFPDKKESIIDADSGAISIDPDIVLNINRSQLLNTTNQIPSTDILVNHLSTSDTDILSQVGHHGYNSKKELLVLNPSRLFYLDLSSEGNEISIDGNNPLQLDHSLSSVNLFRLEEKGYWLEVSSESDFKIIQSGYYLIAEATQGVYNEGHVMKGSRAVSFLDMEFTHEFDNKKYNNKTSSKGEWAMVNYPEESITVNYKTPCGDIIDELNYSLTGNSQLGISHEITSDDLLLDVKTQVIDCAGQVSPLPTINVHSDSKSLLYTYNDIDIDTWIAICEDEIDITGYNILEDIAGPLLDWNIDIEDAISYLSYCEDFEEGFSLINVRKDRMIYDSPSIELEGNKTILIESDNRFRLNFEGANIGSYDKEEVRIFLEDFEFGSKGYRIACENSPLGCGIEDFTVTHIDAAGDGWTRITFSGTQWMQTISPPLSGNFPVEGIIMRR